MAKKTDEEKYTKPDLRRQIKDELMDSDKGGDPGEWSARKSQLLVQEYERQGGGYTTDESHKDEAARSLESWTAEAWQTRDGKAAARKDDQTRRYLPSKVWAMLTTEQARQAEQSKVRKSQEGEQYVAWPDVVKKAMFAAGVTAGEGVDDPTKAELLTWAKGLGIEGRHTMHKDALLQAIRKADAPAPNGSRGRAASGVDFFETATKDELYNQAQKLKISGRSKMNKGELQRAVRKEMGEHNGETDG